MWIEKLHPERNYFRNKNLIENLEESVENLFSKLAFARVCNALFCQTPEYVLDLIFQPNPSGANMLKVHICLMV